MREKEKLRIRHILASGAVGASLVLGPATMPASAADGVQRATPTSSSPNSGSCAVSDWDGTACFEGYGEWFYLLDDYDDHVPIAIKWEHQKLDGTWRRGVIYNDYGPDAGWTSVNKSFEENGFVTYWLCDFDVSTKEAYNCVGPGWGPT
ncbi:hypothetical protein ACIGO6_41035 [Streptomyces sp. NPDC053750]|uniref:hypothetical protein n=1 Tax=Streptomyces sp. NPDC053750 TaxID=3365714 RepID=UPI0037CE851C